VSARVLWRALVLQALAIGALFALLLELPLPAGFFREYGAGVGPVAWLGCSLLVARALRLGSGGVLLAATASGAVAVAASLALGHTAGMVAGVIAFGLLCARLARAAEAREDGCSLAGTQAFARADSVSEPGARLEEQRRTSAGRAW
jgi:hypothetical protein